MDLSAVKFKWPAKPLTEGGWIFTEKKCSRKTAATLVANVTGTTQKTARELVDQLPAVGHGEAHFSGLGQYGGFTWKTSGTSVGFEYVNNVDVVTLIRELLALRESTK